MRYALVLFALIASWHGHRALAGPVNINSADATTLSRELKGIGAAKAAAIVEYRLKNGPFRTADELALVKGVGQKLIDQNRADIRVDKVAVQKPVAAGSSGNTSRK
jgi:competence protein ComEA